MDPRSMAMKRRQSFLSLWFWHYMDIICRPALHVLDTLGWLSGGCISRIFVSTVVVQQPDSAEVSGYCRFWIIYHLFIQEGIEICIFAAKSIWNDTFVGTVSWFDGYIPHRGGFSVLPEMWYPLFIHLRIDIIIAIAHCTENPNWVMSIRTIYIMTH